MRTTKLTILLAVLVAGATLTAFVPTAAAQQSGSITVTLNAPTEPVKPLQAPLTFNGNVILTTDYSAATGVIGLAVQYTVTKQPAWANVLVSPSSDIFPINPPQPGQTQVTVTRQITVTVTATDQAPAFAADQIEISAVTAAPPGGRSLNGKGTAAVVADYFSILDVQLPEAIKVERPQTSTAFPVKISNFGNANTKVNFEVVQAAEGLQYTLPVPIVLQSKQAGGNQISADVPLSVQTPYKNGYMNEVGTLNYKLTSAYALDPKIKGDESTVSVLLTTRGFYVPGPSPILFLGLLGVVALVLRRFR